jgi:hypothetical protein
MPGFVPPLHWPVPNTTLRKRTWFSRLMGHPSDYVATKQNISEQLLKRQKSNVDIWGDDPIHGQVGQQICRIAKDVYDWPTDNFIPDDPFDIVFLMPWDDLELVEVSVLLQEPLAVMLTNNEIYGISGKSLGDLVKLIATKMQ